MSVALARYLFLLSNKMSYFQIRFFNQNKNENTKDTKVKNKTMLANTSVNKAHYLTPNLKLFSWISISSHQRVEHSTALTPGLSTG